MVVGIGNGIMMGFVMLVGIIIVFAVATYPAFAISEDYRRGYDAGCSGKIVPGHQTDNFMSGYTAGAIACHNNINSIQQQIQAEQSLQ
ncbi:MAG TPA: hypothetical protein VJ729_01830 [Nitrososphaeraceae archaeon]|nr:hypothetical protein [Nitrososphaeraceae archaeon]